MCKKSKEIIGYLNPIIKNKLNLSLTPDCIYMYPGVEKHIKKNHPDCLHYLKFVKDILDNPDYIGKHPTIPNSLELVKIYDKNILLSINLSTELNSESYLYISSLYNITNGKLNNRLNSGRLQRFN